MYYVLVHFQNSKFKSFLWLSAVAWSPNHSAPYIHAHQSKERDFDLKIWSVASCKPTVKQTSIYQLLCTQVPSLVSFNTGSHWCSSVDINASLLRNEYKYVFIIYSCTCSVGMMYWYEYQALKQLTQTAILVVGWRLYQWLLVGCWKNRASGVDIIILWSQIKTWID